MKHETLAKIREFMGIRRGHPRSEFAMKKRVELTVHLAFDAETSIWYVAKSDIPGLCLEATTPTELLQRVVEAAPELLELNEGLMARVVSAELKNGEAAAIPEKRAPWAVRPIFDAPLDLAYA